MDIHGESLTVDIFVVEALVRVAVAVAGFTLKLVLIGVLTPTFLSEAISALVTISSCQSK